MTESAEWTKENYSASVTSSAWHYTKYEDGWDGCKFYGVDLAGSTELRAIFEEEMALGTVPQWAHDIIWRMLCGPLPTCGHYSFPRPVAQVCEAIGAETCPEFVVGCYTADAERKTRMSNCAYCLDAWLQEAPLEIAKAEIARRDSPGDDWGSTIEAVFATLGPRTAEKALLVSRLIHRLRWWIKTLLWSDDKRDKFLTDAYLGNVKGQGRWGDTGDTGFGDPYFTEMAVPEVVRMETEINRIFPSGEPRLDGLPAQSSLRPEGIQAVGETYHRDRNVGLQFCRRPQSVGLEDQRPLSGLCAAREVVCRLHAFSGRVA